MSYDISLVDAKTKEVLSLEADHGITGGTYQMGGTHETWLNITYNYGKHFRKTMGEEGIRTIYGMTGKESLPVLKKAAAQLKNDVSDDYWDDTEGNAKMALMGLIIFAELRPEGIWEGD